MNSVQTFWRRLFRFIVVWFVDTLSLLATASLLPGINLLGNDWQTRLTAAAAAALVLGIVNLIFRPIILLFSLPFGFIVVFVVGLLVNALTLWLTAWLIPALEVNGFLSAFVGGLVFSIVNTLLTAGTMTGADDITAHGLDGARVVEIMARYGRGPGARSA